MPEDDAPGTGADSSDVVWEIDPAEDAIKHWDVYRETGQRAALDAALGLWEASLARMPPDSPDRAAALNNVATALTARYEISHARDDLDRGVALAREVLDLTSPGARERSTRASNLAALLLYCFIERGDRRDLDRAVTTLRDAASGADGPSAERALCVTNLCSALKCRYENFGLREDLEEAVMAARDAADYTSPGGVEYVERYDLLASTLELRYLLDGEPDDLDAAVTYWESALAGRGGSALRPRTMLAAGRGFLRRWRLRGEDADRANAGIWLTVAYMYGSDDARPLALEALAAASPEPAALSEADLPTDAGAIIDQIMHEVGVFERTHEAPPLNRAVKGYELVLQHPQLQLPTALRALLTSNAGCLIMGQYDDTLATERLNEAVALFEEAVEAGRAAGGADPWHVRHLGNALCRRYDRLRIARDLRRGLELLEEVLTNASPGDPLRAIVEADLERARGRQEGGGAAPAQDLDVSDEPAWGVADVILGTYEVRGVHSGGGMGLVYRVWHRDSQRDLALKRPRSELFRTEGDKARFRDEAETWVGLGLHPHVVACDYVRTIEGLPCVFAEYLPAGSLAEWERDGRLYAGGHEQGLGRIVDAAIQLAWGLAYAHQSEVVHRDVKPANALMTADGTLKVSDFGLARARSAAREQPDDDALSSRAVSAGGFTLAYASPEQIAGDQVTAATDVWSWATSVLEMFAGEVTWLAGVAAPAALELHLSAPPAHTAVPPIPAVVTDVLRRSFVRDPARRPSMDAVANELVRAYRQLTGEDYPRPAPHRAELLADGLSNHALSMLDLDNTEAACDLWESALGADPQHPHTTYNYGLLIWRAGAQTDTALVEMLEAVQASHQGDWLPDYLLGLVHLERAAAGTATLHFRQALAAAPDHAAEIGAALRIAEGPEYDTVLHEPRDYADALAHEADPDALEDGGYTTAFALSADSTMFAIGYSTGVVVVWNVAPVYPIARFHPEGESEPTLAVGWTERAVIAGDRHGVTVCDVDTHACVRTLGREDAFSMWAFAGECGVGVAECDAEDIEVWDLRAARCVRRLSKPQASSLAAAIRRDGRIAVFGGADGIARMYDLTTGRSLYAFDSNSGAIGAVAVSADGSTVVSGAQSGTVVSWDLGSGQPRRVLDVGSGPVSALALSDDGTTALVGTSFFGESGSAHVWEPVSGRCVHTLAAGTGPVRAVALSGDGTIGCAAGDVDARVWTLGRSYRAPWSYARSESAIERIKRADAVEAGVRRVDALVARDSFMAAAGALDELRGTPGLARHPKVLECARRLSRHGGRGDLIAVYRGPTLPVSGDEIRARANRLSIHDLARLTLRIHLGATLAVAISDDGDIAISGHADGTARTWDLTNGGPLGVAEPHPTAVVCVALSPDGSLAASSSGAVLRVWEATTGKPVTKLGEEWHAMAGDPRAMPFIMSARFAGDGRRVVVGHHNDTLEVWDLDARQRMRTLHVSGLGALGNCPVAVSGDSQFALAGSSTGTLALFDLNDGRCIWSTAAHADKVVAVAFLDDHRVFSAAADGAARVGEIRDGRSVTTIDTGVDWRGAIAVTGDGRAALVATDGLRVWDPTTGRPSLTLPGHAFPFSCLALSRDGYIAVSASQDGEIRMWRLDWEVVFGGDAKRPDR